MTEKPLAIRFDVETIERLDRLAENMSKRSGGVRVTRSDVVRVAVTRGLDALEAEFAENPKRKKS
ncbi:MAG: hypothetical protein IT373_11975 [Polyangiaceae bacterium]|nr:hypothetical protein [Polyangiaceae bacterium]